MVIIKMLGGKCGCPFCKNGSSPSSRAGWKSIHPKHGGMYGKRKPH